MQVKLTLHIQNEPINEPINEPVNEPVNERQRDIISIMKNNPSITREELAKQLDISLATLKRELTTLKNKGYIVRSGSDKNGQWLILKRF